MRTWKTVAEEKRKQIGESIPAKWRVKDITAAMLKDGYTNTKEYIDSLLSRQELAITNMTATELSQRIAGGELSSWDVCYAFCHRAALAHQILNCCVEIFFDQALQRAKELDDYLSTHGTTVGSLHGVPISLKDQVNLPGIDTTIGYVGYVGQEVKTKSLLAQVLEDKGAVFYVKTAVPMAMMAPETQSNLLGTTLNSINIAFSSGGSSGGEGALIGAHGSILGVGTDIGGSIRIPASFQGLYGLRPSHGRIPYMGIANSYKGQEVIPSVIGPLATSLEDIVLFTKSVIESNTWERDPKVVPIPWRDTSYLKHQTLRFAVMWWDGSIMVHPPISRALQMVVRAVEKGSHEVIDWNFEHHADVLDLATETFSADHGQEIKDICALSGEPVADCVKSLVDYNPMERPISVEKWWKIGERKSELREKFLSYWAHTSTKTTDGKPIDALICPVWPTAGFKKNDGKCIALNYTTPFNVIDCASVVFPVTTVDKNIDKVDNEYIPVSELDKKLKNYYDPNEFDKMPVCVQIVCPKFEEEKVLEISSIIKDLLA
ncbi:hypothetical protein HG535_0F06340 [Zygotorulaspora mrakii]|uniref:amidase n=1 Tax=Zygotorulaspora mrakii TaxID=42260 RepID=A0A7H9B8Q8_ZYGMR|nr:uncharacterized protein HG535_0F06340 [Zygotorulaspora mrakii]QLG74122.1 hypothetical protein HG535_0F06340 [Zygotorulaspora mrakii]